MLPGALSHSQTLPQSIMGEILSLLRHEVTLRVRGRLQILFKYYLFSLVVKTHLVLGKFCIIHQTHVCVCVCVLKQEVAALLKKSCFSSYRQTQKDFFWILLWWPITYFPLNFQRLHSDFQPVACVSAGWRWIRFWCNVTTGRNHRGHISTDYLMIGSLSFMWFGPPLNELPKQGTVWWHFFIISYLLLGKMCHLKWLPTYNRKQYGQISS